jgi:glycosyltransferase involved in cell wall biosynthesis
MHVGVITSSVSPHQGGAFTFEHELLESLKRLAPNTRYRFSVIGRKGQVTDLNGETRSKPAMVRNARMRAMFASRFPKLSRTTRRQSRGGTQANWLDILLQELEVDLAWFLSPATKIVNVPFYTVVWDLQHRLQPYFPEVSGRGEWEARESAFQTTLRRATGVFAGTEVGSEEIQRFYQVPKERIHILPHPTPRFALTPPVVDDAAILREFKLDPGFLLYPAQFWSHKNHAGLLQSLCVMRESHRESKTLVLVGSDQGNRSYVESLVRQWGLGDHVRFLNFVTREQLIALYRQAAALTYVSYFGPENLPPLEAFALGCPVIASRVSGAAEQFSDAAILVDPKSPEAIADAVIELTRNPDLRSRLVTLGLVRASRFTGDDFVAGAIKAFDDFSAVRLCWGQSA